MKNNVKRDWKFLFFGLLFWGGLLAIAIYSVLSKPVIILPEEIDKAEIGDTLIIINKTNSSIELGFKNKTH